MDKYFIITLALAAAALTSCQTDRNAAEKDSAVSAAHSFSQGEIPYLVAEGYFQNNTVKELPAVVTTRADFDSLFGMAVTMGPEGQPTPVDFIKQFVIAVGLPETDRATAITPVCLKKDEKGQLTFSYRVERGERRTYTTVPNLLLVVDSAYKGEVLLREVE